MSAGVGNSNGHDCDVAIIGGGVVGMSIAYGLLGQDHSITVLDEGDNAFRASRGNFALVWLHGKGFGMPEYARWTARSVELWHAFANKLEHDSGLALYYTHQGGIMPCLSDEELESRVALVSKIQEDAPDIPPVEVLDHKRLKAMVPAIGPDVVGGTFGPVDGYANALRLLAALHKSAIEGGVTYRPNQVVSKVEPISGGFRIHTDHSHVRCRKVVLAAGLGNKVLAPMLGMSAPVAPQRGEAMITEKLERLLPYPLGEIIQTAEGGLLIGVSHEDVGYNKGTDSRVLTKIARRAVRIVPRLADVQIVRTWGALRVMSPDGFPIYDRSDCYPDAYLVTCHSGITLAAAHAGIVAQAIADDTWPKVLRTFSAQRFENVSAPA